jgi:hypothetical protein
LGASNGFGNTIWRRAIVSSSRPLYREVGKIEAAS